MIGSDLRIYLLIYSFILSFFLAAPCSLWDLSSPTRDPICALGSEKCRVLTTRPRGNSQIFFFLKKLDPMVPVFSNDDLSFPISQMWTIIERTSWGCGAD